MLGRSPEPAMPQSVSNGLSRANIFQVFAELDAGSNFFGSRRPTEPRKEARPRLVPRPGLRLTLCFPLNERR
jgi:hypothetical protein